MPFSSNSGKALVDRTIQRLVKQFPSFFHTYTVLDIGAGSGTYSQRYSKSWLRRPKFQWTAIEIWEPYVAKYGLGNLYDTVRIGEARTQLDVKAPYDIAFVGDVLEHMTKEEAVELLELTLEVSQLAIVSIPLGHYPQDEYDGNPYEKHVKDDWTHQEVLDTFKSIVWYGAEAEIGVYVLSTKVASLEIQTLLRPQVGVYGICKNERAFLKRCYDSVRNADFVCICDTGSTDGTLDDLASLTVDPQPTDGELIVKSISVQPWRFDDARNCALSMLPEEVDVCISIDMDEVLQPDWKELLVPEVLADLQQRGKPFDRYYHRFSTIWDWQGEGRSVSEHWHERIHARRGYRWKLPVHEVLVKKFGEQETVKWLGGIKMTQLPDTAKPRNYLPMIEQAIKEDGMLWRLHAFKAAEQAPLDAINTLTHAMTLPGADVSHLKVQRAEAHERIGHLSHLSSAEADFTAAALEQPLREHRAYLARFYVRRGQVNEARFWYTMALKVVDKPQGYHYNPSCWNEDFEKEASL